MLNLCLFHALFGELLFECNSVAEPTQLVQINLFREQDSVSLMEDTLPDLDEEEMEDLYRHFLMNELPEVGIGCPRRGSPILLSPQPKLTERPAIVLAITPTKKFTITSQLLIRSRFPPLENNNREVSTRIHSLTRLFCQDDEADEDFEPPVLDEDEEGEEAGVRRRNIQARELNDLLQDAYKQVNCSLMMRLHFDHILCRGIMCRKRLAA